MKQARQFMLFALVAVLCALATPAIAQEQGRPDPTGQGRYVQFGPEVEKKGAEVLDHLPSGVECFSVAGTEMNGKPFMNSTRKGFAVKSVLTDKATIAVPNGEIFLCKCIGEDGSFTHFNRLLPMQSETAPPAVTPASQPAAVTPVPTVATATATSDVYVVYMPLQVETETPKKGRRDHSVRNRNIGIGTVTAIAIEEGIRRNWDRIRCLWQR